MKEFDEKINNQKVIVYKAESSIRILVGKNDKMSFDNLKFAIEQYRIHYNAIQNEMFSVNNDQHKASVKIKIAGWPVTIRFAFKLYSFIIDEFKLELQKYNELHYNRKKSTKICPI